MNDIGDEIIKELVEAEYNRRLALMYPKKPSAETGIPEIDRLLHIAADSLPWNNTGVEVLEGYKETYLQVLGLLRNKVPFKPTVSPDQLDPEAPMLELAFVSGAVHVLFQEELDALTLIAHESS